MICAGVEIELDDVMESRYGTNPQSVTVKVVSAGKILIAALSIKSEYY